MRGEFWPQRIAGSRYDTDAAPVGIDHVHSGVEVTLRRGIAARPHDLRVTIIKKAATFDELPQYRIECGHETFRCKSSDRSGYAMFLWYEGPLLRAHHCRHVTGRDEGIEAGGL